MESRRGVLWGTHVLVVEDNADAREILRIFLAYVGAMVTVADTAAEGLRILRQVRPDIVIADMNLGDHDASWLIRRARQIPLDTPFLAISAMDFDAGLLERVGFEAFLRKPIDHDRLVGAVLSAIDRR